MQKEINWLLKEKYGGIETPAFFDDVKRLEKGEPLDYVIGFTNFLGCKIDVSKRPLIPRQETEYWVGEAIEDIKGSKNTAPRVLDIFAGSGCVGIGIMRHIENSHVVFAEKEPEFIEQIKINAKLNNIAEERYNVIQSDIFFHVTGKFDYILANPPYIPAAMESTLDASVIHYEPKGALFGGDDGLVYIKKFLEQARAFLTEGGKMYMEFDSPQQEGIGALLKELGYNPHSFHKDQYGKYRWVVVQWIN